MDSSAPREDMQSLIEALNRCSICELLEAIPIPVFIKTEEGIHIFCNTSYLDILSISREEVIGFRIEDFAPAEIVSNAVFQDERLRVANYKGMLHYRTDFTDKNGKRRYVQISKCGLPPKDSRGHWVIGTVEEVTEEVNYHNELTEQHRFLRTIIDNLPQLIYAKDLESRFTLANKATALLATGKPDSSALMGKTDAEFFRPELWVKYYNDEQDIIRSGKPMVNNVEVIEDTEGNLRWSNTTKMPLRDESGKITGIIGIGSDFTQFKKSEEQLRLHATALESAADGILITDRTGTIMWANSAMSNVSGYSPGELIGKTPKIFKSGCHTEDFYRKLWRTITSGQTWKGEIINRRKDNQLRTDETTITPVSNEEGRITHFISICRDITDRELLRQEMSRIYTAVTHSKDGIMLLTKEGRPFFVNKSFVNMLGYEMSALPTELLEAIYVSDESEDTDSLPPSEGTRVRRTSLRTASGDMLPLEIRDWAVKDNNEEYLGQVFSLRDLTDEQRHAEEQKMLEVRLRQAQKMEAIGQLAAGIAHEINNPIQFVGNNTTFLQSTFADLTRLIEAQQQALEKCASSEQVKEVRQVAEEIDYEYIKGEVPEAITQTLEGVRRVSDIVKAMKDFSHPGTKNRQRADMNKAVGDAILVARNEWKYNSEIVTDLDPALPNVLCLAGEVNQAILNILVNAAHAINEAVAKKRRDKGIIKISTRTHEDEVQIVIEDNGCGIPKRIQDRIFEPFFTTKEVGKGTGQGLAITYDTIVRKHNGRITFNSVENEGTTFVISLPINGKTEK